MFSASNCVRLRCRNEILEIRPGPKAPREEHVPETDQQLGRHTGQHRRGSALHQRLYVFLQGRELLQVQRQDVRGQYITTMTINNVMSVSRDKQSSRKEKHMNTNVSTWRHDARVYDIATFPFLVQIKPFPLLSLHVYRERLIICSYAVHVSDRFLTPR